MSVLMWGIAYLACLLLVVAICGAAFVSMFRELADPVTAPEAMGSLLTIYAVGIPLSLVAASIVIAATCRVVLTPDRPGFFYMRLGGAELRLFGAYLLILIGFIISLVLVVLLLSAVFGGAMLLGQAGDVGAAPAAVGLIYPILFGMIILWTWVSVRLSLIGPITVAERRFAIGRSWQATKGRFWTLIDLAAATAVRWFIIYMAMIILMGLVGAIVIGAIDSGAFNQLAYASEGDAFWSLLPFIIGYVVFIAAFSAIQFAVLSTPFAAFYRDVIMQPAAVGPDSSEKV